ncbi:MAG: NAD+ synthase [Desulfovibrionaceae bacterium]|nr:NAD+ synthase [Desulfovibrionaceae bacterium]MBF0514653.1 NAD+ synthase [Desulfovibrionaceae bacterium]
MKIGLLQLNPVVGDLEGNASLIVAAALEAKRRGADLCLTTEMAVTGYPPRDLLLYPAFVEKALDAVKGVARSLRGGPVLLAGLPVKNPGQGKPLFNAAALLRDGEIAAVFHKNLLPTYDVFDEDRYFQPGAAPGCFELAGVRIGVTICEDIWNDKNFWQSHLYANDPVERLAAMKAQALVNLSASPFSLGKQLVREDMTAKISRQYGLPLLYANQAGGNDDLVFDGRSMACDARGILAARAKAFEPDILVVDLDRLLRGGDAPEPCAVAADDFSPESEAWRALVAGTRDYARKCGFAKALLGLSGGVDSALTAVVAAEALGPENVLGALMPSPYSSPGSIDDSLELAANLGIQTMTLPIGAIMESFGKSLAPAFAGLAADATEENIQSRIRGNLLMALSNKFRALLLTTGNKSELAVGYCTIYGDMSGGLAVISDAPKTLVYKLAAHVNERRALIPRAILDKPPSAELAPGQTDQDSLPPYDVLDAILELRIRRQASREEIIDQGFDPATVDKVVGLVKAAEFKRRQAAPGIKITDRAFGAGWRMPLASKLGC